MKFFGPRNDWNMSSPRESNWWGMSGSSETPSGIRVNEATAMTLSSVFAATRVISETLASLPCSVLVQKDARTTDKAIDHPLWKIVHDEPNYEIDCMSWFDSQVAFQVNWGNAYAEIQRDSLKGIVALWPIHPSRIPLANIIRNGTRVEDYDGIVAGLPGEIVYYVNNDDGSKTPIPASDMLHVPGVLSSNGVTGQSIVRWAATSIGNALAADAHAGAIFKNGAVTNMVLKSPKTLGPEAADRLRRQWQNKFGGVGNHYKTLLLEEGVEPQQINMNPEDTQLLETRRFTPSEIARWYRLPPHLLGDLSGATNSNIESEGLSFITYSMLPWITRWEKAMQRQLLTAEEKKKYRFKFNVNGLLRGDKAARAVYYQTLFNLGSLSPNDIRGYEDLNPVEGGDQYFVQGNNAVPLDKIGELVQANIDKAKAPPPAPMQPQKPEADSVEPDADDEDVAKKAKAARLAELRAQTLAIISEYETRLPDEIKAECAFEACRKSLSLAIQGEASQLMQYETRAAKEAAKKPATFLTWQAEFYPKFTAKLTTAIGVFAPAAQAINVTFDVQAEAEAYVTASVASLDKLADLPCNELETGVEATLASWIDRPKQLAESLFRSVA